MLNMTPSAFLFSMHKKKFSKQIISFVNGESSFDELEVGKFISSYLTHAFIEAQKSDDPINVLHSLKVTTMGELLSRLLGGDGDLPVLQLELRRILYQ